MIALTSFLSFIFVTLFVYWIEYRWKNRRLFELSRKLPGHDGFSIFESIKLLLESFTDNYNIVKQLFKEGAPITKFFAFNYLIILTKDADMIHQVLNMPETYNKPKIVNHGFPFKKGLIVLKDNEHKRHRKILNKAFVPKMLERLPPFFDRASKKFISKLSDKIDCGEFDILNYINAFSLEAIGTSNFGYETEYFKSELHNECEHAGLLMIESMAYFTVGFNQKTLNWTKLGKKIKKMEMVYLNFFDAMVKSYRATNNPERNTAIDLLLNPENEFDETEIKDECQMLIFAAFDTSSRTIATILMMLGIHKEVQQKLIDEIDTVYNESNNNVHFDLDFVNKFKYLEAVINESMRLYTVAPYIPREFSKEADVNGYLIPKGAIMLISIDRMHRDEKYWGSDAHVFRPERFLEKLKYPKAFKPFSGGRRICIGYRYAMISMKIFLINFFRTYKVDCTTKLEDIKVLITLTLDFVNGYKVSIQKRN